MSTLTDIELEIAEMPNRYLCDVLEGMRQAYKTRNFSYMLGLIEEAQYIGERMEAGLADVRSLKRITESVSEKKEELKTTEESVKENEALIETLRIQITELQDIQAENLATIHKWQAARSDRERKEWEKRNE